MNFDYNFDENFISYRKGNVKLTNREIEVLDRYEVPYKNLTMSRLLTTLDDLCNTYEDEDLEIITEEIATRNYYDNTRK